ncbi:MAG: TetR/AcrR family transcriptional regulator [Gemmatimonadaceae bacterium]|nr:TetR/AcrR family transcriptional regulator [Gemmatimonadaceae bacterium]NUQ92290.1 TetR/AcrR family transcriptional regulator [Gemmatimonadaceae bacterium]NUR18811.1 TetR/AcrR family transcriptional regulator [Gemmatimonadaceae bacterium]NUS98115.1 TetR/AcrR family transcriptional regulator [Gemmatimonadaceae bacterium]
MPERPVKSARRRPTRPPARERRRRPDERPAQILEAALDVFGEKGLAAARLDDIAKRAGVAKGTIYLYFPNKDELFRAVIRSTVVAELDRAESVLAAGPPDAQLQAFMKGYWAFLCTPTFERVHRLVMSEMPHFPDLARFYGNEVVARSHKLIAGIISEGIAAGLFRAADPYATARMIMASFVMHGVWRAKRVVLPHLGSVPDAVLFEQLSDFIHAALRPDARGSHHSPARVAPRSHS